MSFCIQEIYFHNRAPFEAINLKFSDTNSNIFVLSGINGVGKTTILTHITDAFYELAKVSFTSEFETKANKYYRISSSAYSIKTNSPSIFYMRFRYLSNTYDYIDIRGQLTEEDYNRIIKINNKISFDKIGHLIEKNGTLKFHDVSDEVVNDLFNNNILTFFPAYRFQKPGYLTEPYQVNLSFNKSSIFKGELPNQIEVVSNMEEITNWILDTVLDSLMYKNDDPKLERVIDSINNIINLILNQKHSIPLRLGIGKRNLGFTRIRVVRSVDDVTVYPSIFNLSSGEIESLCLFTELLRQSDRLNRSCTDINGVVLIDEIDKHLHIKLQHEVLPKLLNFFPNIQFILTSHSPFLNLGLAENSPDRTAKIVDLDNGGLFCNAEKNELFKEVYEIMITENERFLKKYDLLNEQIKSSSKPLIITEGKTDWKHYKNALAHFQKNNKFKDLDLSFFEDDSISLNDSKLDNFLLNSIPIADRLVIGIFDSDSKIGMKYKNPVKIKENIYAFSITSDDYPLGISVEMLYDRKEIINAFVEINDVKRRLYYNDEFTEKAMVHKIDSSIICSNKIPCEFYKSGMTKIIDNGIFNTSDVSLALSKEEFASNILCGVAPFDGLDLCRFEIVFETIQKIIHSQTNNLE